MHFQLNHLGAERSSLNSVKEGRIDLMATLASGNTITWFQKMIQIPSRSQIEPLLVPLNISTTETLQLYRAVLPSFPGGAVSTTVNPAPTSKLPGVQQDSTAKVTSSVGTQMAIGPKHDLSNPRYVVPAMRNQQRGDVPDQQQVQRLDHPHERNTKTRPNALDSDLLPPETESTSTHSTRELKHEPDHLDAARMPRIRSRSRSPARARPTIFYREREDPRYARQYHHDEYVPPVRRAAVVHLRGVDSDYPRPSPIYACSRSAESSYEYRHPPPPRPVTPRVLYDAYGNEYVHTNAAQPSYILYPLPPREYY